MKPSKKAKKRLDTRIKSHEESMKRLSPTSRPPDRAYRKPGSMKKVGS